MLIRLHEELERDLAVTLEKTVDGKDATVFGAFMRGTTVNFSLRVPTSVGSGGAVLRIFGDDTPARDLVFRFCGREGRTDRFDLAVDTADLCGKASDGLFFYHVLLLRGFDTLFSDSRNNVDLTFSTGAGNPCSLLVYEKDFHTPAWFRGGTMYHVFLDRFRRGKGKATLREGAILESDWENGIPQFAERNGDPLANNLFFGGNLWGVIEKLDFLVSLGVTILYLSPIFESVSNHRYDTADYETVDPLLGGREALDELLAKAHERGIRVILDGVFNHTGDDSRYFNRRGHYPTVGAYQSQKSPYAHWYHFRHFPNDYECWWNIPILPRLNHTSTDCRRYFTGEDGIAARWIREGIDGWRLDVADELSDPFLDELRKSVKGASRGEAILIGEVWENAATKIAYGRRRRYLRGEQLDSVMNYPFRNAVLALIGQGDAATFADTLTEIYATYPKEVSDSLMNLIGTHDTERILTVLGDPTCGEGLTNRQLSVKRLDPAARRSAIEKLKLAATLQFTVYGVPSVYYGDEAGVEGYHDPFCRMPYPWGREEETILSHYRALGNLRREHPALRGGTFRVLFRTAHTVAYLREGEREKILVCANVGDGTVVDLPSGVRWKDAFTGEEVSSYRVFLEKFGFRVLVG